MNCRTRSIKRLFIWALSLGILVGLTNYTPVKSAPETGKMDVIQFDAIFELNAPLARTHVVLFARYWVSPDNYRAAFVWAEPHSGGFNFPVYPPTLNVVSEPNTFRVEHQIQKAQNGIFPKPLGQRGPFHHRFNVYRFSDIRFAEQEALNLRIRNSDVQMLKKTDGSEGERILEISATRPNNVSRENLTRLSVRATKGRLDELRLLDTKGELLKSVEYKYAEQKGKSQLLRQNVLLPERPITVAYDGKGPTITIGGKKRQYSQFQTTHHQGGRKCVVDYQAIDIGVRTVTLPVHITVYRGDSKHVLRSVRLCNFNHSKLSPDQIKESAEKFSLFDTNEIKCREMLLKYWVKDPAEVAQADRNTMEQLRAHFAKKSTAGLTAGEQLRHVNVLLQLDWMLGHATELERNFRQYMSLLSQNKLDRMTLFGGEHAIELTFRWRQVKTANKLLEIWLDAAMLQNDVESVLNFATDSIRKKRFWTTVKLMDKVLDKSHLSPSQCFVAQSLRCISLAEVYEMVKSPGYIKTEFGIAQAWWVASQTSIESIQKDLRQGISEAKKLFSVLDKPTRQHNALRAQLDKLKLDTQNAQD